MPYVFLSFGSIHTGKPLGACVLMLDNPEEANDKAIELGLLPNECNRAFVYVMDEQGFKEQGMELNRFYTPKEMEELGFSSGKNESESTGERHGRKGRHLHSDLHGDGLQDRTASDGRRPEGPATGHHRRSTRRRHPRDQ